MKGTPPDGVIRVEIFKLQFLHPGHYAVSYNYSSEVEVKGVPWRGSVSLANNCEIDAAIECLLEKSMEWSIDMDAEFVLVNSDASKNCVVQNSHTFLPGDFPVTKLKCFCSLIKDSSLIDPAKGFINDLTFTIEMRFWITKMRGIRIPQLTDFANPNDPRHDVALIIDGEKIYVSKQILAFHSPVFRAMFFGDFAEKNKKEIEIKDVYRDEFVEMLHVIYPSNKKITDYSAEFLLNLGDQFQIESLMDRVEKYLFYSEKCKCSIHDKIYMADKYNLFSLKKQCIDKLATKRDCQRLKWSPAWKNFSEETKAAVLEREANFTME